MHFPRMSTCLRTFHRQSHSESISSRLSIRGSPRLLGASWWRWTRYATNFLCRGSRRQFSFQPPSGPSTPPHFPCQPHRPGLLIYSLICGCKASTGNLSCLVVCSVCCNISLVDHSGKMLIASDAESAELIKSKSLAWKNCGLTVKYTL